MKIFTLSLSLLIAVTGFGQRASVVLNKGQKLLIETNVHVISSQEFMGQAMESTADLNTNNNVEVNDVKDTGYTLSNNLSHLKLTASALGKDIGFDSDKPEDMNSDEGSSLKNIINHPIDILIDKKGNVIQSKKDTGSSKSTEDMLQVMIGQLTGNTADGTYGIEPIFMLVPGNLKIGHSWTDTTVSEGVQNFTTYSIKEIKGNNVTILIAGSVLTSVKSEIQGVEMTTNTTGILAGEEILDITSGVISNRNTVLETKGNIEAMGAQIPMTSKVTSVINVKSI